MAFKMEIATPNELCDICRERDDKRPMPMLSTTGKTYDMRNYIWMHVDCFERKLSRVKAKLAAQTATV